MLGAGLVLCFATGVVATKPREGLSEFSRLLPHGLAQVLLALGPLSGLASPSLANRGLSARCLLMVARLLCWS